MSRQSIESSVAKPSRSPGWAAVLGLILPGLGQIYCRQDNKGVFLAGMALLGHWSTGGISSLLLCPAMGLDAFLIAQKLNGGAAVRRWEFFPGIKGLEAIPPRIVRLLILAFIATATVIRILRYAADYQPNN